MVLYLVNVSLYQVTHRFMWLCVLVVVMSSCFGEIPTGTKTDSSMREFIEAESDRLGVTKAEFHRRLLEFYRESRREQLDCPHCGEVIAMDLSD